MSIKFLKVKVKSLSAESRIIRQEELCSHGDLRNNLRLHRVNDVRHETRATLIAYNFLRGVPYQRTEPNALPLPDYQTKKLWGRVETMVKKYGTVPLSDLEAWRGIPRRQASTV